MLQAKDSLNIYNPQIPSTHNFISFLCKPGICKIFLNMFITSPLSTPSLTHKNPTKTLLKEISRSNKTLPAILRVADVHA